MDRGPGRQCLYSEQVYQLHFGGRLTSAQCLSLAAQDNARLGKPLDRDDPRHRTGVCGASRVLRRRTAERSTKPMKGHHFSVSRSVIREGTSTPAPICKSSESSRMVRRVGAARQPTMERAVRLHDCYNSMSRLVRSTVRLAWE